MRVIFVLFFVFPVLIFAQNQNDRIQKSEAKIDSLLKALDRSDDTVNTNANTLIRVDSLLDKVNQLTTRLNDSAKTKQNDVIVSGSNQTVKNQNSSVVNLDNKATSQPGYYIVLYAYANEEIAIACRDYNKLEDLVLIKSPINNYYLLTVPYDDPEPIGYGLNKYRVKYGKQVWWVKVE